MWVWCWFILGYYKNYSLIKEGERKMTKNELLGKIAEALETEIVLSGDTNILDIEEWDSLSSLSIIALFDELFSHKINRSQLNNIKTIKDLIDPIAEQLDV
jgi:acyl carrier protein